MEKTQLAVPFCRTETVRITQPGLLEALAGMDEKSRSAYLESCMGIGHEVLCHQGQGRIADAVLTRVVKGLEKNMGTARAELRESFSEVFGTLRADVMGGLDQLRQEVLESAVTRDVEEALAGQTPLKGFVFEEKVEEVMAALASSRNDRVDRLGTSPSKSRSKVGDFVYEVNGRPLRIVVEAKNHGKAFTHAKIRELMTEAREVRDAGFGIFVVQEEAALPPGYGAMHFEHDFVACTLGFLEIALKTAIFHGLVIGEMSPDSEINMEGLQSVKTAILGAIENMKASVAQVQVIRKSLEKLEEAVETSRRQISQSYLEMETLLRAGKA